MLQVALLAWIGWRLAPQVGVWVGLGGPHGPAPALAIETRDRGWIADSELDDRVVLVIFWATWCLPCRVEMPVFQDLHERYADEGLLVLGLAADGDRESEVEVFLDEMEITFPIGTASGEVRAAFGGVDVLPTTILIDRQGQIRHRVKGLMAPPAIRAAVRRLLERR